MKLFDETKKHTEMSLPEFEKFVIDELDQYMEMFNKKIKLEKIIQDTSIDDKKKCEAYMELIPMMEPFSKFERNHLSHLQALQTRLIATMTDEQKDNLQNSRLSLSM